MTAIIHQPQQRRQRGGGGDEGLAGSTRPRQGREAARFSLLLGASGSGKSSLARAGVMNGSRCRRELAVALPAAFEVHGRPRDWGVIRAELHAAGGTPWTAKPC